MLVTIQLAIDTGHVLTYYQDEEGALSYSLKERGQMGFKPPGEKK